MDESRVLKAVNVEAVPAPRASDRGRVDGPNTAVTTNVAPSEATTAQKIGTFHALRYQAFRLLWIGTLFSSTAYWVQGATLSWLVYDMTGSGSLLGGVNGIRAVPTLLMLPLTGVMVDRLSRRNLMLYSQIPLVILSALLGIGLVLDKIEVWHLFVFVILGSIPTAIDQPARATAAFDLVPRDTIPNAIALNSTAFAVTRAIGPGGAAFLLGVSGAAGNFFIMAVAFAAVAFVTMTIAFPPKKPQQNRRSFFRDSYEGFKYAGREPLPRMLMIVSFIMPILIIPTLMTLLPVFAKSIYHTGSNGFAVLIMAVGIGNLFGALFTASLGTFERRSVVQMGSLLISASALLAFAFAPNTYVAVPLLFLCGLTQMIFIPTNQTLIQLSVPEEMRGRITTILQIGMLLMPVGMMVAGALADAIGTRTIVGISSATAVVLTVLVWSVSPTIRNIRLSALESRA